MTEIAVLEHLGSKLDEQIRKNAEALVGGGVVDFPTYRELCGVIRGLQTAQLELGDLVRILKANHD